MECTRNPVLVHSRLAQLQAYWNTLAAAEYDVTPPSSIIFLIYYGTAHKLMENLTLKQTVTITAYCNLTVLTISYK